MPCRAARNCLHDFNALYVVIIFLKNFKYFYIFALHLAFIETDYNASDMFFVQNKAFKAFLEPCTALINWY